MTEVKENTQPTETKEESKPQEAAATPKKDNKPKENIRPEEPVKKEPEGEIYTYVGAGTDVPQMIEFMGRQKFLRGRPTEVTDPEILKKIRNHPCFVKGEADPESMMNADMKAIEQAQAQRRKDSALQEAANKRNAKFAVKGE